jgi:hypothetical protein
MNDPFAPPPTCKSCGCSQNNACIVEDQGGLHGCYWVSDRKCSACEHPETRKRGPLAPHDLGGNGIDDEAIVQGRYEHRKGRVTMTADTYRHTSMKNSHTITIDEGQRQLMLLALAVFTVQRPGMEYACSEIARVMDNITDAGRPQMYDQFREYNTPLRRYTTAENVTLSQEDVTELMAVVGNVCKNVLHNYPDKAELLGLTPKSQFFIGQLAGTYHRLVKDGQGQAITDSSDPSGKSS